LIPLLGDLPFDRVLAVDDSGAVLRASDVLHAARRWETRLEGEKRLVVLTCDNTCEHLREYLALVVAGQAVVLVGAGISDQALNDLSARYHPWAVVRPGDGVHECGCEAPIIHPDLSVLLSTSGSTGSPKLVRFSAPQLEANADAIIEYLGIDADERPMAHLPFNYSFGLSIIHSHLRAGSTILLSRHSLMNGDFWSRMAVEQATSLSGVPFHFEMLLKLRFQRRDLPHLKTLTQAGGKLAPELVQRTAEIAGETGRRFFVMYGQTEAGPRISYLSPDRARTKPSSIGRPIPGVGLSLASGADFPEGSGELVVESPSVMMGYAESAEDLARGDEHQGRLATGDIASQDADGDFFIVGRTSRFIKLQGNRVNLAEIEHRLASIGLAVVCVGVDDHLWIATEQDDPERIRSAVLDEFTFPSRATAIVRLDRLPRSDSGKVLYRELLETLRVEGQHR
jgi:long-chain acyl-CoA synthetase